MTAAGRETSQSGFAFRFGWGLDGLDAIADECDVIVVVDVLRFTSATSAAVESGATVLPYRWRDETAAAYAEAHDAVLAGRREQGGPSLSPTDLLRLGSGTRIVLPSPNGSTVAFTAAERGVPFVLAGCLRNATATAKRANALANGGAVGVIAAGERWHDASGPLRPAFEDLIGAGAVLAALDPAAAASPPRCSPEANAARAAFAQARPALTEALMECSSGRELCARGFGDDVATAAELDVTDRAAQLEGHEFVAT